MFSGLLGPLTSSFQGLNGGAAAGMVPEAAGAAGLPGALGGAGALGGGGGGSLVSGTSALSSTFVRPASSFSPPNAPTLPGGWQSNADKETTVQARSTGVGGGGLYGAPPGAMGRESGGSESERPSRTLQVTARQGSSRGEKSRI